MTCRGICHKYHATKPHPPQTRYGNGQKRCNECDIFMEWDDKRCPCCGHILRLNSRNTKYKKKLELKRI